jgi:hypothetical protein
MHLWRQLLVGGPKSFGEVFYYGTAPYVGVSGLADVLIATRNVAECEVAFDPQTGLVSVLEMTADPDADSCTVRFSDYKDVGGRQVPHQIEVCQGDTQVGVIALSQVELAAAAEAKP